MEKAVRQFFFLNYPTSRKTDEKGKTIQRSNLDDRNELIKGIGEEEFYRNANYKQFWDYPCPFCFLFIFKVFLELYNGCTVVGGFSAFKHITWQDIESYCKIRKLELTQLEIDYLLKIKGWASDEIYNLEKEE